MGGRRWAARFEALSKRERWCVLAAMTTALAAGFYFVLIGPAWLRWQGLSRQETALDKQLHRATGEQRALAALAHGDPDAAAERMLGTLRARSAQAAAQLAAKGGGLLPPEQMAEVLRGLLRSRRSLHVISLRTLPAASKGKPGPVYRHGIEIRLRGRYFDLVDYVAAVGQLPWRLVWGGMRLKVDRYPDATLTLTLYTLSLDKTWLTL